MLSHFLEKRSAPTARDIAISLSDIFLAEGKYASAPSIGAGAMPAAAAGRESWSEWSEYSGLSIQAVGYEHGNENPKVHIYVSRGSVGALKKLRSEIDGIPVQINNIGEVKIRPEMASNATAHGNLFIHQERVACGSSCAPSGETYSGTMGAIARDSNGQLLVLSNNHVLAACNHVPVGMPVMAPSNSDARPNKPAPLEIGRHHKIVELRSGEPTLVPCAEVDAAVALVSNPMHVSSWQGDDGDGYDTPSSVGQPVAGLRVKKFGRTTGLTHGTIESLVPQYTPLPYKTKNFSAVVWFKNIWTILGDKNEPFALPGDSGSLVVTEDGKESVGLIFAVSRQYGLIVSIQEALSRLGDLSLVSNHGIRA